MWAAEVLPIVKAGRCDLLCESARTLIVRTVHEDKPKWELTHHHFLLKTAEDEKLLPSGNHGHNGEGKWGQKLTVNSLASTVVEVLFFLSAIAPTLPSIHLPNLLTSWHKCISISLRPRIVGFFCIGDSSTLQWGCRLNHTGADNSLSAFPQLFWYPEAQANSLGRWYQSIILYMAVARTAVWSKSYYEP